ncbi:glycosyltransferase [Uliginosibacterium sp. TH139]|uniref:glycosyltransferase n=1 Tax=Uliginosibacterium sp. TH139 TaxID=2067453 RepID=UPI000C7E0A96|nr:glycosyltransferase [Uliginosibacterium sp. TH139]PLK48676.1 hypothetical protein C0V76_11500 [Uliginosibacterium sp. TH139]
MSLVVILTAFVLTALGCRFLAQHAARLRLIDMPDARKQHGAPIPVVGGLAVLIGFVLACALAGLLGVLTEVAGPLLLMLVIGLVDDARNLSARFKLLCQIVAAGWLVYASGAALYAMPLPFLAGHLDLGWAAKPLTVLMIVAVLNAINMIDGLDGLAGGCLSIASLALALAAQAAGRPELAQVAAILCAGMLGFLLWNARWPWQARAKVFLGDAGALAIGMLLCWLILKLSLSWQGFAVQRVPLTVVLAPVAVPVIDLFVVAFWRAAEGRNPMQADRGHSHHLLLEMGLSTVGAVRLLWLAAALIALTTFAAWRAGVQEGRLLGVLLAGSLAYLVWFRVSWLKVRKNTGASASSREHSLPEARPAGIPRRVLFVTSGLGVGGAERALERLLPGLQAQGLSVAVVSLREPQAVGQSLRALGVEVFELGMAPSRPTPMGLWRLWGVVRTFRPDVIQGWMYHGNLAAQVARLAVPRAAVVLAIHQTLARPELESLATRAVIRCDALLSRFAAKILYVAQAAVAQHEAAGYAQRALVLPNALDTALFRPDAVARAASRAMLGVQDDELLIAMIGRLHPAKNHAGFLRAAALVAEAWPAARFLCAGLGVTPDHPALAAQVEQAVLQGKVFLLGPREDVPALLAGCDLSVLSSIQEALPNAVAEAMSCGLPCVVTNVGDAGRMIGDTGWLIEPGDDELLAHAIELALGEGLPALQARGQAARQRIEQSFAVDAVAASYAQMYRSF